MRKSILALAVTAASLAVAAPASAGTVFTDNFDGENGGASSLQYTGFANFTVSGGVDLVATPNFGITCAGGSGSCVDLDGTPGPGILTSASSFSFNAGDFIRFSFDVSGSQRSQAADGFFAGFIFSDPNQFISNVGQNITGMDEILIPAIYGSTRIIMPDIPGTDPFSRRSIFFTANDAGSFMFNIGTDSADNLGPLVDNLQLDITSNVGAVPEPATWAMMILGFGLVGGFMRRRKSEGRLSIA